MEDSEKLRFCEDTVDEWQKGGLSDFAAMMAISLVLRPQSISPEELLWARDKLEELKKG
jgi:hypothetical protein